VYSFFQMTYSSKILLIDIKISTNDVFNFHKYFFFRKKLECLSKYQNRLGMFY
jgi:hypothetical protein